MEKDEIKAALISVIEEIQSYSGMAVADITDETRPIGDIKGFDSVSAVESCTYLSELLGCEIKPDIALFKNGLHCRTIDDIAEELTKVIKRGNKNRKGFQKNERK
jgi:acyl carrier protein